MKKLPNIVIPEGMKSFGLFVTARDDGLFNIEILSGTVVTPIGRIENVEARQSLYSDLQSGDTLAIKLVEETRDGKTRPKKPRP